MLQKLNERIQGFVAWVIIILVTATFALFGVQYYVQSHSASQAKAEVNGQMISAHDFDLIYRRAQQQESAPTTAAAEVQLKQALLNEMIKKAVSIQAATSSGLKVTTAQTINVIQSIPQFQQEGHFSVERYQQGLNHASFTPDAFQKEVQQDLLLNQQRFAYSGTAFALPNELKQFVALSMQTRDYDYLVIPYQAFMQQVKLSDTEINTYYQQHRQAFKTPEKVEIEYVRLSMRDIRENTVISETEIKHYYDENKNSYYDPAKWHVSHIFFSIPANATPEQQKQVEQKALDVYNRLKKSPNQFDDLVKTHSDDKLSVVDKGVLPWIIAGQSEFDKSLLDLKTVGQFSLPVKTSHGYEIFKLLDYKPATLKSFDSVEQSIKDQLILERVQTEYSHQLEELSELAYQSPDSLMPIVKKLHLSIQKTEPFSRDDGKTELTKNPQVIQAAFSPAILSQGDNSEPLQIDNESVIVLRLVKHIPAAEQSLPEVKSTIQALLTKQQAESEAKKIGQRIMSLQQQISDQNQLLDNLHIHWQDAHKVSRENNSIPDGLSKLAFQAGRIGTLVGDVLPNGDYVLIRVTKINDGQLKELDKSRQKRLLKQIAESHGAVDYDLYVSSLLNQATIERY